jgi:hypothetical protein
MPPLLSDRIVESMEAIKVCYHRLVLVVGPSRSGKTIAVQQVQKDTNAPIVNINLELSKRLLDLTERQRALQIPRILEDIVSESKSSEVLLDNNEMLFDIQLQQDPLRLLQQVSRNRTIVATWNGHTTTESLFYATPDHPEFRNYPLRDIRIVPVEDSSLVFQPTEKYR